MDFDSNMYGEYVLDHLCEKQILWDQYNSPSTVPFGTTNKSRGSHEACVWFPRTRGHVHDTRGFISAVGSSPRREDTWFGAMLETWRNLKGNPEEKADGRKREWDKIMLQQDKPGGWFYYKNNWSGDTKKSVFSHLLRTKWGQNVKFFRKYIGWCKNSSKLWWFLVQNSLMEIILFPEKAWRTASQLSANLALTCLKADR